MQPQQPQIPPAQPANYDFIMNPGQAPKKRSFGGGNSLAMRLLVVVGGLFVLAIVAVIVMNLLGAGGGGFDKKAMLSVAQDQTEIVRLASRGGEDAVSQATKNFAITAQLGITSEQKKLFEYLASVGYEPAAKDLGLKLSTTTDTQLDAAKSSSTFDTAYASVMKQALETYKSDLNTAYNSAKSSEAKKVLQERYKVAVMLQSQLASEAPAN
ncbi:MAG TPA: hypothetical protein VGE30_01800 [Candidatus Saccharimonadales bacterium]